MYKIPSWQHFPTIRVKRSCALLKISTNAFTWWALILHHGQSYDALRIRSPLKKKIKNQIKANKKNFSW